jgi:hypothetical protein
VAESPEPAAANEDPKPAPLTLAQRMSAITKALDAVGKDDIKKEKDGKKWTERGHIVEAILSEVRPLLAKYEVDLRPSLIERAYAGNRCDVLIDFTFARLDDPADAEVMRWGGTGTDNGDKAFAKAGTNALKEMLKKRFLITDRSDAKEEEEQIEHRAEGGASRDQVDQAKEKAARALQLWATSFKAALESASTEKERARLQADNADQLNDPDLPAVTRQFFFELLQRRKSELVGK